MVPSGELWRTLHAGEEESGLGMEQTPPLSPQGWGGVIRSGVCPSHWAVFPIPDMCARNKRLIHW